MYLDERDGQGVEGLSLISLYTKMNRASKKASFFSAVFLYKRKAAFPFVQMIPVNSNKKLTL
jgi:hypothetical protein